MMITEDVLAVLVPVAVGLWFFGWLAIWPWRPGRDNPAGDAPLVTITEVVEKAAVAPWSAAPGDRALRQHQLKGRF